MTGAASFTVIEIVVGPFPPEFVAVIVNEAELEMAVGVPEMTQAESIESPVGSVGEAEQETIAPPVFVGPRGPTGTPFVKRYGVPG
jgi:hypothetical protein